MPQSPTIQYQSLYVESLYCSTPTVYSTIALELMVMVIGPLVH